MSTTSPRGGTSCNSRASSTDSPDAKARRRADELLELVGLVKVADQRIGTYSGGMRRRIDIVGALMHDPDILFLDEPTVGLDPQSRIAMWEHLDGLNTKGVTILLTTQVMEEADRLCRDIAIIDHGKIVASGSPESLKAGVGGDVVQIVLSGGTDGLDDALNGEAERGSSASGDMSKRSMQSTVASRSLSRTRARAVPDLVSLLHAERVPVGSLSVVRAESRRRLPQAHRPRHPGRRSHRRSQRRDAPGNAPEKEVAPMNTARETYFIYMRNIKAWLGQPPLVVSTLMPPVFMFPVLRDGR